jgi:hypothetical protein
MADLNVQPKKRSAIWPWLLLAVGVIVLILFLTRGTSKLPGPTERAPNDTAMNRTPSAADSMGASYK